MSLLLPFPTGLLAADPDVTGVSPCRRTSGIVPTLAGQVHRDAVRIEQ